MPLVILWIPKTSSREFPGSPVVRALCFCCRGHRLDPWSGKLRCCKSCGTADTKGKNTTARTLLFSQKSLKISSSCLMAAMSPLISLRILHCLGKVFTWASGIFSKELTLLSFAGVVKWHCLVLQSWGSGGQNLQVCQHLRLTLNQSFWF